jgi:pancreatic triacylglycerol lipase
MNLGLWGHTGDTTFFPNGGESQPGCGIDAAGICAHERSNIYLAESVITGTSRFFAMSCENLAQISSGVCTPTGPGRTMGGEPSNHGTGASGLYRLHTNSDSPFGQG